MEEKIKELQDDKIFIEKLGKTDNVDEIQDLFRNKGIDLNKEDIEKVLAGEIVVNEHGEITEGELENVSGGIYTEIGVLFFILGFAKGFSKK